MAKKNMELNAKENNTSENKFKGAKWLKKSELVEMLVALDAENEKNKARIEELQQLLEKNEAEKNSDDKDLISLAEVDACDAENEEKSPADELKLEGDILSDVDDTQENEISQKYLKYSTYSDYKSSN